MFSKMTKGMFNKKTLAVVKALPELIKNYYEVDIKESTLSINCYEYKLLRTPEQKEVANLLANYLNLFFKNHRAEYVYFDYNEIGQKEIFFTIAKGDEI